jgi:hypothetical protein
VTMMSWKICVVSLSLSWVCLADASEPEPVTGNVAAPMPITEPVPAVAEIDPDVPEPFDPNTAMHLLEKSPFTRALNLSESLLLTGVAYVDGKPVATIKDVTTNKHHLVSDVPNAMGWRLAGASPSSELSRAEVQIVVGSEIVALHYSETQMLPQKRSGGSSGGAYNPSRPPTKEEFTGRDEKGEYVRASPYLNDKDRDYMRGGMPRETRDQFLKVIHDNRERMFKYSHEDRATFVKKVFDSINGKR